MLRKPAEHIIIDGLTTTTVNVTGDVIRIEGYGEFTAEQVLQCYNQCPTACTKAVKTVTVTIPESCECPYEWAVTISGKACPSKYDVQSTFNQTHVYNYVSPDGSTPTATTVKDAIVAAINAHAFGPATAASTGAATFTITEKDCDSLLGTCGIDVSVTSGSVANTTPHSDAILPAWKMKQQFPIKWGAVGSDPKLARCGDHCVFYFNIRKTGNIQDIDMGNTYSDYDQEVYFYVDPADANYDAYWLDKLTAELTCLTT